MTFCVFAVCFYQVYKAISRRSLDAQEKEMRFRRAMDRHLGVRLGKGKGVVRACCQRLIKTIDAGYWLTFCT